jgi:HD-GYP domain-containing protein (c-di-GMP phosphodiesterase class II)
MKKKKLLSKLQRLCMSFITPYTDSLNRNSIEYWQAVIFYSITFSIVLIGALIYIPSTIYTIQQKTYSLTLIYSVAIGTVYYLYFFSKLSITYKTLVLSFIIYSLSVAVIINYGPAGIGTFFLFIVVLICSLFIGLKASLIASVINLLTMFLFEFLYYKSLIRWDYLTEYSWSLWFLNSLNIFFVGIVFAAAISLLIHGVKKTFATINKTKEATITGLAKLAEYKDTDTGMHLERIREYAGLLAATLSKQKLFDNYITYQYIDDIYISSTLHDIGKVGVPDMILLKPGKLDKGEFEIMKKHSKIGTHVIEEISLKLGDKSFLDMAQCIAHFHHEKWDGSGYPNGLSGNDIPLSARIVALADVYDALTSKRVYKDAFTHDAAVQIITKDRGKHFDPDITDVFVLLQSKFNEIRLQYNDSEQVIVPAMVVNV